MDGATGVAATATRTARQVRRATTEQEKDERRNTILGAAKKVFAKRGYHATTVADIAKVAKISYGSIYWYFESKDALFHALMENEAQALRDHVTDALSSTPAGAAPDAPFRAAVRATFEFFEADKALVRLLFRDSHSLGDRFENHLFGIFERFVGDIEAIVEDARRQGLVVEVPRRMAAFCVAALVGQVANRRLVTDDGLSPTAAADFVVSLLLNGLVPRRGSASRRHGPEGEGGGGGGPP